MKINFRISGTDSLTTTLENHKKRSRNASVIVGYTANYAMYVHEMTPKKPQWGRPRQPPKKGAYWDPTGKGQPKFLETPARQMSKEIVKIVETTWNKGGTILQGLYVGGLRLQRESQKLVPVDTGNLKASAFTRKEN